MRVLCNRHRGSCHRGYRRFGELAEVVSGPSQPQRSARHAEAVPTLGQVKYT